MRKWIVLCILLRFITLVACDIPEIYSVNGSLNSKIIFKCPRKQHVIYFKSARFGYLGENGGVACSYSTWKYVRNHCYLKRECSVTIWKGPHFNDDRINCSKTPQLYIKYICVHIGSSIAYLSDASQKLEGYLTPSPNRNSGIKSKLVIWEKNEKICYNSPRFVHFTMIDLRLSPCEKRKQDLTIKVDTTSGSRNVSFCGDVEDYRGNLSFGFPNFSGITFSFSSSSDIKNRGFLLQFIVIQCKPLKRLPLNSIVEYWYDKEEKAKARVKCNEGFIPNKDGPSEVIMSCDGLTCAKYYGCDAAMCNTAVDWKNGDKLSSLKCVKRIETTNAASTTTTPLTTVKTTRTTDFVNPSSTATTPTASGVVVIAPTSGLNNSSKNGSVDISIKSSIASPTSGIQIPKTKDYNESHLVVVAGIVGGIAGFMVCLVFIVLLLMICKKSRKCLCGHWCCNCFDGVFFGKTGLTRTQSHLVGSMDDSTMAVRYRVPPSSTGLDSSSIHSNNNRSSLAASSTLGSLAFPSYRRNKKKPVHPLPHPSQLGYSDETALLYNENGHAWSPSVETYLEPNRRPSASSMGATGTGRRNTSSKLNSFHPKPKSSTEYQVYDETRSSRMGLDHFDGPSMDPRRSQALQSNHYYCRDDHSVDSKDRQKGDSDCESVYESMDDGMSSVSSDGETPRGARRFHVATRNEYVQPPALPERPPGMDRSSRQPQIIDSEPDVDEYGYQPVNVKGRVNIV